MVDPTMPSWAPKSCFAYHAAVVHFVGCSTADQASRDAAKAKYDTESARWHDMHDAQQSAIDQIRQDCSAEAQAVKAQSPCLASAQPK